MSRRLIYCPVCDTMQVYLEDDDILGCGHRVDNDNAYDRGSYEAFNSGYQILDSHGHAEIPEESWDEEQGE